MLRWFVVLCAALGGCAAQPAELPARERHPSLFFDNGDRPRMRANITREPWARWWQEMAGDRRRSTPAFRWWLTGDEDEARRAREDLLDNPIGRQKPQGYLEPSSHQFNDYVAAYDLLGGWGGLSARDHAAIRDKIAAEADYYYDVLAGVRGGANYGNQRTLGASALGMAALALCEYTGGPNGPRKWLERALAEIRRPENMAFFRPGGLFVEGAGYTTYMNAQFVPFAIALERATGQYLFAEPVFREWLAYAAYQMMANGEVIPWGTCESQRGIGFFGLLANRRYGRDLAPLFHRAFNLPDRPNPNHRFIALAQYEAEVEGAVPPASRAFPESQAVVLREDWGHDGVAVWFEGKDSRWGTAGRVDLYRTYSHGDAGHFVVAMADETLATDSGYDHWHSKDYFGPEFHNVILVDGKGPEAKTFGRMSAIETEGPVRHATVTSEYAGATVRRTLALVRGRYVVVADRITTSAPHEYAWQVRSTCPPEAPGTRLDGRAVTWPGLSSAGWRDLEPGRTELTTVTPPFTRLMLAKGRWRPISARPEFANQVARAEWKAANTTALFVLIPNRREGAELSWRALRGQDIAVKGPGWEDRIAVAGGGKQLRIAGSDGKVKKRLPL